MGVSTAPQLQAWLVSYLSAAYALEPQQIDVRQRFYHHGLDSLGALRLVAELSREVSQTLSPTLIWEYPTIAALAAHLAGERDSRAPATPATPEEPGRSQGAEEPIAIVGMACRLPGAPSVDAFWQLLRDGRDAISEVPADRGWDEVLRAHGATPEERAKVGRGGFLPRIDEFDPLFFGISPREAAAMDPQQRLMLELCWEALEEAGLRPESLRGSRTGVFAGAIWSDYSALVYRGSPDGLGPYACTGVHHSIIANRISYVLGLEGPSLTIDSASSSGLVVVHLACDSVRRGESQVALAGAVNLNVLPESALAVARIGALSPDGRCYTFDARASGYVRGEGGGVVVLKTLSRAIADGDRIHAVIRGSAVNNDGASNGMTAPSRAAQEAVLRQAYGRAGVRPDAVQYVEAHGTATPLGDPIEARALGAVLGAGRPAEAPLLVGSVKTNVGHLEGAAGMVGLIKAALAIEHRVVPPSLNFESPNPHAPLAELGLAVPTAARPWPAPERALTAGVSSFGLGGTNCHAVLEEWPAPVAGAAPHVEPTSNAADTARGAGPPGGVVFVFPGQGAQWPGMARSLLHGEPVFRAAIEACDRHIRRYAGWSLVAELAAPEDATRLDEIAVSLPAIIAFDIATAAWWRSLGVEPAAVVGHSTGEIAAAHVAGALDLDDAMRIICAYGRLVARCAGQSGMAFVGLPWDEAERALAGWQGRVYRAIEDSAVGTVVAGEPRALAELLEVLEARGVFCRPVSIDAGPHSPLVAGVRGELLEALQGIRPRRGRVPLISEVSGAELAGEALDPAHWVRNFSEPAFFSRAIDLLIGRGHRVFIDVGPHPITAHSIEANLRRAGAGGVVLASGRRGEDGRRVLRETAAALHGLGVPATIAAPVERPAVVPVPVLVSARSEAALRAQAARLRDHLVARPEITLADVAYALATTRSQFEHRAALIAADREVLLGALDAVAQGRPAPSVVLGQRAGEGKLVFVFPGQGSQWPGMARSLLDTAPVFRDQLAACERALSPHVNWSLLAVLRGEPGAPPLERVDVVQPTLFAVMVGLAALWRAMGVEPDAVVGHSQGEIAAACVAGALSLEDAAAVVALRSRALTGLAGHGAMAAVELGAGALAPHLAPFGARVTIAAINSPTATVVAGEPAAIDALVAALGAAQIFARKVRVDYASHNTQVEAARTELEGALAGLLPRTTAIPFYSTVSGEPIAGTELDGGYWYRNLRHTVRFADAAERLLADGYRCFVEVSPHPVLAMALTEVVVRAEESSGVGLAPSPSATVVGTLRRDEDELARFLLSLGELHTRGQRVDWSACFDLLAEAVGAGLGGPPRPRRVDLPTYAFQRQRFWLDAPKARSTDVAAAGLAPADHPLLGAAVPLAGRDEVVFTGRLCLAEQPWLADHAVFGTVILAGTVFLELALVAAHRTGLARVDELVVEAALAIPAQGGVHVQVWVGAPDATGRRALAIHARAEDAPVGATWTRHVSGTLAPGVPAEVTAMGRELRAWPPPGATALPLDGFYPRLAEAGLSFGAGFQGLREVWQRGEELFAEAVLPAATAEDAHCFALHPALLDAALHALMAESRGELAEIALMFSLDGVSLRAVGASALRVRFGRGAVAGTISLAIADDAGEPLAQIEMLVIRPASAEQVHGARSPRPGASLSGVPLMLPGLVRGAASRMLAAQAPGAASLRQRLGALPAADREQALLELVRGEVAAVLGITDSSTLLSERPLAQLGLDSLTALEIINRLATATGLRLPSTLLFERAALPALAGVLERRLFERSRAGEAEPAGSPMAIDEVAGLPPVELAPDGRHQPFELAPIQLAYWLGRGSFYELGGVACHGYGEIDLRGLDVARLERALNKVIARHDMLRVVFDADDQQQRVLADVPWFTIEIVDRPGEAWLTELRAAMSHRVLPADRWPLFELRAAHLGDGVVRLFCGIDLMIVDLRSIQIVMQEVLRCYADEATLLAPLTLTFRDYVRWSITALQGERGQRDWAYWRGRAGTLPPGPELPLAVLPKAIGVPRFEHHERRLDPATYRALKARATQYGLTPSNIVLAAFGEVLGAYSRAPRFTLNLTFFNRPSVHDEMGQIVGDFTSTLLIEIDLTGGPSFAARARRHQHQLLESLDHSLVSGVDVMRELARKQGPQHARFPVVLTSGLGFGELFGDQGLPGVELLREPYIITQTPQVWLDHQVRESHGELRVTWDVVTGLFPAGMIDTMIDAYADLLRALAASDEAWTRPDLVATPKHQLDRFAAINATAGPAATDPTWEGMLHEPVEAQARLRPDAIAVVSAERRLTYRELVGLARRLGRELRAREVGRDELVAIVMDKGWEQVVSVLGVLHGGGAYLPIAADLPAMRRDELLAQGQVRVVLTQRRHAASEWPPGITVITIADDEPWTAHDTGPLAPLRAPDDLAYVIFTSGSTGRPKGVAIEHRSALNTIRDVNEQYGVGPADRVFGLSSLSFDLSVWDVFGVLGAGGTLVLPEPGALRDPERWLRWLRDEGVTIWNSVPALLEMIVSYDEALPGSLRLALLSGDWIPVTLPDRVRARAPGCRVVSLGGATEASIWSIWYPIDHVDPRWTSIPYGRPMRNQTFHVLDECLRPRPVGVTGELYIGGIGLARGYYGDPAQTAERFITHPMTGERLYRTGDLGRWQPEGTIEFLGRQDHQVKVGGHRIELGEIEHHLLQHPQIKRALVDTQGDRHARRLVAYVEPSSEEGLVTEEVRRWLAARLPGYMVPAQLQILSALPLSSNGKVDRAALLAQGADLAAAPADPARVALAEDASATAGAAGDLAAAVTVPSGPPVGAAPLDLARLAALSDGERCGVLTQLVQDEVAAVLGVAGGAHLPADRPIQELGLDSLRAIDVRKRLSTQLGIKVALAHLLGAASAAELGSLLVAQLVAHGALPPPPSAQAPGDWEEFRL